jgi:hypothetical protein
MMVHLPPAKGSNKFSPAAQGRWLDVGQMHAGGEGIASVQRDVRLRRILGEKKVNC